ncbi:tetratricopeptide repeat protein [Clostridium psychrophilum]|uniref:tetratricopeptide repeat protein n=1 Tax=Clostridium psychrophilum TaxID=132926 RepID=UPI0028AE2E80|nr:hypothetical protein [Clostridium psychrophilum]
MKSRLFKLIAIAFVILVVVGIKMVVNNSLRSNNIKNSNVIALNNKTKINSNKNKEIKKQQTTNAQIKRQKQIDLEKTWKIGYDQFFKQEYKQAISTQRQVIKEDPNFYKAYAVEGIALAYSGNFNEGMKQIDHALKLKPNYGYGRFNKALANELFANYDEAIKWYKKDLEVENYEWSYYGIASIYGRRGDVKNAIKYLKLAIDISPSIKNTAKNEKDFNNVRKNKEFSKLISIGN